MVIRRLRVTRVGLFFVSINFVLTAKFPTLAA